MRKKKISPRCPGIRARANFDTLSPSIAVVSCTDQIMIGVEVEQEITEGGTEAGCGLKCLRIGKMRLQGHSLSPQAASRQRIGRPLPLSPELHNSLPPTHPPTDSHTSLLEAF